MRILSLYNVIAYFVLVGSLYLTSSVKNIWFRALIITAIGILAISLFGAVAGGIQW
jgi:hypothetical protein